MGFQSQRPKSPLKKHTQYAATVQWTMIASPSGSSQSSRQHIQKSEASNSRIKALRAKLVQTMLSLMDQRNEAVLQGHVAILQQLSTLSLENPHVRNSCLDMLRQLKLNASSVTSSTDQEVEHDQDDVLDLETVASLSSMSSVSSPFVYEHAVLEASDDEDQPKESAIRVNAQQVRDSGRPRCSTLNASPQFLRASANEVHDLDDQSPTFDYAETCGSETDASVLHRERRGKQQNQQLLQSLRLPTLTFDYASSTIDGASSLSTAIDDEDLRADQGSQLSEMLHRAEYLSESCKDEDQTDVPASSRVAEALDTLQAARTRLLCRQALRRFRFNSQAKDRPAQSLATKYHVFAALRAHRAQSPRSLARKTLVFTRLKQQRTKRQTLVQPSRLMYAVRVLVWSNMELLGLLLLVFWAAQSVD